MEEPVTFKPAIVDHVNDLSVGDKINIWGTDTYAKDTTVCKVISKSKGNLVAITIGGNWPLLFLDTISKSKTCQLWKPKSNNEGELEEFSSQGEIRKFQKIGRDYKNDKYEATETVSQWKEEGVLPL